MSIDVLFKIDVLLYNFLLFPRRVKARFKYRNAFKAAKRNGELITREKKSDVLYICGNGPSLRKVDLNDIDCDYLVVNDFFRFEKKNPVNPPKYYMLLDDTYLYPGFEERYNGVFNPGFETTYILTGTMKKTIDRDHPELKDNVYYFCPFGKLYSHKKKLDYRKMCPRSWNVVSEAIMFGMYLGYKEIRLLGLDFSVFVSNAHFYSNVQAHPVLRKMLFKYSFTTEVHYEIARYAKENGIKIVNMTSETLLDAYEIDTDSKY